MNTGKYHILLLLILVSVWFSYSQNPPERVFYFADTAKSKVYWKCDIHRGYFGLRYGGLLLEDGIPVGGAFVIPTGSFTDTDIDRKNFDTAYMIFHNTIKNEFLEIERYPYAYFIIERITPTEGQRYSIQGNLTLHGVTRPVVFNAGILVDEGMLTLTGDPLVIDRSEWGILRLSPKNPEPDDENGWTVPDEVEISVRITAVIQQ